MARPPKNTVDYFPHDANASDGRTLSILFNYFGHEGISAWWLLLERVSATNNHVIDISNTENMEYLSAKMKFKPERLQEILSKLASLEAIDSKLFEAGFIWSDNLIDRLEDVYKRRKQNLPSKPKLNGTETKLMLTETELLYNSKPQSKVKETKVNKSKVYIPLKKSYGEFLNVKLTDEEMDKLKERFNNKAEDFIEQLSIYLRSKGKQYKDHYATILNWARRAGEYGTDRGYPKPGKTPSRSEYTRPEELQTD